MRRQSTAPASEMPHTWARREAQAPEVWIGETPTKRDDRLGQIAAQLGPRSGEVTTGHWD
ncbi:hypothetical protein [Mycobacterium decipiens]|uniref:hypothetical protein n=1 Tax=Mycobacterium decipiens TaxID=1430326 RepID=UPI0010562FC2|nr:hypothetical protein [Mycobacterium decipiens]